MKKHTFKKPSRGIDTVFLHCSASDHAHHDNVKTMESWHLQRGFNGVGYHYFVRKDGTLEIGRSIERSPAAQKGHNKGSIAICCHGLEKSKFTQAQFKTVRELCNDIQNSYGKKRIRFRGHREVSSKSCPVYDYKFVLNLDDKGFMKPSILAKTEICPIPVPENKASSGLSMSFFGGIVKDLQTCLKALYCDVRIDGLFGQQTRLAVESAQRVCQITVDGECNGKTLEKVFVSRKGDKGVKVKKVQSLLVKAGYKVKVDGDFGPNTYNNVRIFQKNNNLNADGVVGPKTLQKFLDLGIKV